MVVLALLKNKPKLPPETATLPRGGRRPADCEALLIKKKAMTVFGD